MATCSYCAVPLPGSGLHGRAWPNRPAAVYCCYGCLSLGEEKLARGEAPHAPVEGPWFRLGSSLFLAGQAMTFGLAVNLSETTPHETFLLHAGVCLATSLVVLLLGWPLLAASWSELRLGRITVEALFLVSVLGAFGVSLHSFARGTGPIYFEVVAILLVVYTLGKVGPALVRRRALASAQAWSATLAHGRLEDGRTVPVGNIRPGDVVVVHRGEAVCVDGRVLEGNAFLQDTPLTGEPFARVVRPGDGVLAGSISQDGTLRIRSERNGTDRVVDRLLAAVEEARNQPWAVQRQADRLASLFVPLVVLTAGAVFWYWLRTADAATGWLNAMSVLLVACPCALGLATPLVVWLTLARLGEQGLVVRSGAFVERLARVDQVLLDKTGTLTDSQAGIVDLITTATGEERGRLLARIAAAESGSRHPIARAFHRLAEANRSAAAMVLDFEEVPGKGISARIADETGEHRLRLGVPDWLGHSPNFPEDTAAPADQRIAVEEDGRLVAVAVLAESLRDGTPEALADFASMDLPVTLLTGDPRQRNAASDLAVCKTGLLPEEKAAEVRDIVHREGHPLFVGDGVNDAGALSTAWAGIAVSSGSDLAADAADAVLYRHDLRVLPWAVALCRSSVARLTGTMQGAFLYNLAGMTLAAAGMLHPVVAALLMACSSIFVAWSSTRIGVVGPGLGDGHACEGAMPLHGILGPLDLVHGLSLALQGVLLFLLAAMDLGEAKILLVGFVVAGLFLVWVRLLPLGRMHGGEMATAMFGLGGLGMVAGWWADTGFAGGVCTCELNLASLFASPWMYLGMVVLGSLAMILGPHWKVATGSHKRAMLLGGNLGMIGGMMLGAWAARWFPADDAIARVLHDYLGMMVGMTLGMFMGDLAWKGLEAVFVAEAGLPEKNRSLAGRIAPARGNTVVAGSVD